MKSSFTYQAGGSLKANFAAYVPRLADEEIYQALQQGEFCYVLTARQMGKSSLKVRTIHRLRLEDWLCVDLDITRFGSNDATADQWYFSFLFEIASAIQLEDEFEDWWEQKLKFTPVARFSAFWLEFLCTYVAGDIAIFIDEVDSMLSLKGERFSTDDFFAAIRALYNESAEKQELDRIHFCILGVASPDDLMADPARTPFNIGKSINLTNFRREDAVPLLGGLKKFGSKAESILNEIIYWSGGQPYLTQRLCQSIVLHDDISDARTNVEELVHQLFLSPGRLSDEANLSNVQRRAQQNSLHHTVMLNNYGRILNEGRIPLDLRRPDQIALKLTGLAIESEGSLGLSNPIYGKVFDQEWLERIWDQLERPFREQQQDWFRNDRNRDFLLRGEALRQAIAWAQKREDLTVEEQRYINSSRTREEYRHERLRRRLRLGLAALTLLGLGLIYFILVSEIASARLEEALNETLEEQKRGDSLRMIALDEQRKTEVEKRKTDSLLRISDSLFFVASSNFQNLRKALIFIQKSNQERVNELIRDEPQLISSAIQDQPRMLFKEAAELIYLYIEAKQHLKSYDLARSVNQVFQAPLSIEVGNDTTAFCQAILNEILPRHQLDSLDMRYYPNMVSVGGGEFNMGTMSDIDQDFDRDELPQHSVRISDFSIAQTELTVYQYRLYALVNNDDSILSSLAGRNGHYPITNLSWYDAVHYCNWLSIQSGNEAAYVISNDTITPISGSNGYRLPTEAEWEYAAKGGQMFSETIYAGGNTPDLVGWYDENAFYNNLPEVRKTGTKAPNSLGLYDLSGNVWEWCWDWYDKYYYSDCFAEGIVINPHCPENGTHRVSRGGSWNRSASNMRVAKRDFWHADLKSHDIGFRIARSHEDPKDIAAK